MTFLKRLMCRFMISLRYCFEMSSKRFIQDHFQTFHSKVVRKRVNKKKNARGKTGTVLEKSMCHLILCHVKSITGKVFYYSRPLFRPSSSPFHLSFKELAFHSSYRVVVTSCLQRYSTLPLSFSFSSFLCHRLHIIPPSHTSSAVVGGRSFSSSIFARSRSPLAENRCYYLPGQERLGREGSTFFFTFLLYIDSTVRPLGTNRWHAGEVEMLPT